MDLFLDIAEQLYRRSAVAPHPQLLEQPDAAGRGATAAGLAAKEAGRAEQ